MVLQRQRQRLQKLLDKATVLKEVDLVKTGFFDIMNSDNPYLPAFDKDININDARWIEFQREKVSFFEHFKDNATTEKYSAQLEKLCRSEMTVNGYRIPYENVTAIISVLKQMISDLDYQIEEENTGSNSCLHKNCVRIENNESELLDTLYKSLVNIQKTIGNKEKSENELNDLVRNLLSMVYTVYDQTRHGVSTKGKDAGNVDLVICNSRGVEIGLYEGLVLHSVETLKIKSHIDKATVNYNPVGCQNIIISVYYKGVNFVDFWIRFFDFIKSYEFSYQVAHVAEEIRFSTDGIRGAKVVLKKNGKEHNVLCVCTFLSC